MEEYGIDSQYILFTWAGVSVLSLSHLIGNVPNPQSIAVRAGGREIFPCYRGSSKFPFHHSLASHSRTLIRLHWAKGIWIIHATVRLTPASGLFSAQGILTAWSANDELFVKGTIGQISVVPSWALKQRERFVYTAGCFCEALHIAGCAILAARCRAQSALCWAPRASARSRVMLRESVKERLQRQVKTSPPVALVVKIPYYQAATRSYYLKPPHFYSMQV